MPEDSNAPVIVTHEQGQVATLESFALDTTMVLARKKRLQSVMEQVMQKDQHYGVIPGTNGKPSLLKPGAEAILSTFQLAPRFEITKTDLPGGHREYEIVCNLYTPDGLFVGSGVGSATSMEGKYRFRRAEQKCPECGQETIIKGKKQYGGGWLCWAKKGGCGVKFPDGDERIENQNMGKVEHDNPADYYNTVLKMGKKRALVDATLTATGASDIFTQDIEDMPEVIPGAKQAQASKAQGRGNTRPAPPGNPTDQMDPMPGQGEAFTPPTDEERSGLLKAARENYQMDEAGVIGWLSNFLKRPINGLGDITDTECSAATEAFNQPRDAA